VLKESLNSNQPSAGSEQLKSSEGIFLSVKNAKFYFSDYAMHSQSDLTCVIGSRACIPLYMY